MNSWMVRRAKAGWLAGFALALAGLLPVLLFALRSLLPNAQAGPLLDLVPQIPSPPLTGTKLGLLLQKATWLPAELHGAFLLALFGLGVMALGRLLAQRQERVLEAARMRRRDALRRVQHYRDTARLEPVFADALGDPSERDER